MAPRLLPSFSTTLAQLLKTSGPAAINCSTLERMRSDASDGCSSPSTENTPRICDRRLGTSRSTARSRGSRKNWSSDFSISPSARRNSSTTLPMVWRSLTRR